MRSPTKPLVAALALTLILVGSFAAYTLHSVNRMRHVQTGLVERNGRATLQLIRIQSNLNSLALALRDIQEEEQNVPLSAWRAPLARIRQNLDDAVRSHSRLTEAAGRSEQTAYLENSFREFWNTSDSILALAENQREAEARAAVRRTLEPRLDALTALTARLLVERNEVEAAGGQQVLEIFNGIESTAWRSLAAAVVLLTLTGAGLIYSNRALFARLTELAEQRRELARQLITTQESTFRTLSRDLHDEFGQILTALGAMLRRAERHAPDTSFTAQTRETAEIVQSTLENIRHLSQSLQPVMLEEQGLLPTMEWHLERFEHQTGIPVHYTPPSTSFRVSPEAAIHGYRIVQEALNNAARHAGTPEIWVTAESSEDWFRLVVEDSGQGLRTGHRTGTGLVAMRERAELIGGELRIEPGPRGGVRVELRAPLGTVAEEAHG